MGAVFRAKNRVTGQLRAIKVVKPELTSKRDFVDRFVREATIASQLRHPNLVETLEPGIDGETIYLPMELLEGETLAHHMRRHKRLTPAEAAEILVPVAEAVQLLHDRGVVHRDLKPMNIFVTRTPRGVLVPKVIDLGTARDVDDEEHTRTGMVVGSPFYMAPEQAEGRRDIDGRADQYALGVIAYQMITGARPYESDDMRSALAKLLRGEPYAPPSRHFPGLLPAVEAVIVRALERDRDARFPRIADLGHALAAASTGVTLPPASLPPPPMLVPPSVDPAGSVPVGTPGPFAPPPSPVSVAPPAPSRRSPLVVVAAVVVLFALAGGAAAFAWGMSGPDMTATPLAPRTTTTIGATAAPPTPITVPSAPVVEPAVVGTAIAPAVVDPAPIVEPALVEPAPVVEPADPTPEPSPTVRHDPDPTSSSSGGSSRGGSSGTSVRGGSSGGSEGSTRPRGGSRDDEDDTTDERGGSSARAPCGAATGIPCLE